MTNRRKALWAVAAVMTLLVVTAISIPNLLRSRKVDQSVSFSSRGLGEVGEDTKLRFMRSSWLPTKS